jgi:hypothetical protein
MSGPGHEFVIDADNRWVVLTYRGQVSAENVLAVLQEISHQPGWRPEFGRLLIFDRGEFGGLDPEAVRRLADQVMEMRRVLPEGADPPNAYVCADPIKRTAVLHWLGAMATLGVGGEVFSSRVEAEAWLRSRL